MILIDYGNYYYMYKNHRRTYAVEVFIKITSSKIDKRFLKITLQFTRKKCATTIMKFATVVYINITSPRYKNHRRTYICIKVTLSKIDKHFLKITLKCTRKIFF